MPPGSAINYININRVLKTLWEKEPISRIEIARNLDLDKSTITKIIAMLLDRNIVVMREEGSASPVGGRKPVNLGINRGLGAILGIELQTDTIRSVTVGLDGSILDKDEHRADLTRNTILDYFQDFALDHIRKIEAQGTRILAVSLGVSGLVNPYKRVIYRSNPLDIHEPLEIGQSIERRLRVPVFIENDARCCCWGDLVSLRGSQEKNFLYLLGEYRKIDIADFETPAMGIGIGIVIDGQLHYGSSFSSGEFKSVFKEDLHLTQFRMEEPEEIRDPNAAPDFRGRMLSELGKNVAFLYNMLNLNKIGIAGDLVAYESELTPAIHAAIEANWSYPNQAAIKITYTSFGRWAVAYGAAALVLEQLFGIELFDQIQGQIQTV